MNGWFLPEVWRKHQKLVWDTCFAVGIWMYLMLSALQHLMGLVGQGRAANLRHFSSFGRGAQWNQRESTQGEGGFLLELQKSGRIPGPNKVRRTAHRSQCWKSLCVYVYIYILYYYIHNYIYIIIYSGTTYFIGLPSLLIGATWSNWIYSASSWGKNLLSSTMSSLCESLWVTGVLIRIKLGSFQQPSNCPGLALHEDPRFRPHVS